MKELLESLSKAKQEIQPIIKNATNPFYKKQYADINAILLHIEPILHKNGLVLIQPIVDNTVWSKIYHVNTWQVIESSMTLPTLQDPQKMGIAVTYYRRYTLQSLLSLQAKDDDGEGATEKVDKAKPELTPSHISWVAAKQAVKNDKEVNFESISKRWTITQENYRLLCS